MECSKENPKWSSLVCFSEAIADQKYLRSVVARTFMKYVDQDDYNWQDRKEIFKHLMEITSGKEEKEKKKRASYWPEEIR